MSTLISMVTSIHSMARSGGPLLANPPPDYSNETLKFSHYLLSIPSLTSGPGQVALHFVGYNDTFNLNLNLSLGNRNVHKYLLNIYGITVVVLCTDIDIHSVVLYTVCCCYGCGILGRCGWEQRGKSIFVWFGITE